MKRLVRAALLLVVVAAAFIGFSACRRNTTSPTVVPTAAPVPIRGVIATFGFDQFSSDVYVAIPLPLTQGGVLDVTLDWTYPTSWIYVYIARGSCTYDQLFNKTCPILVTSESQLPKPRFVKTENLTPGTYSLILYNVPKNRKLGIGSDNTESVSFLLGLTVGAGATAAGPINVKPGIVRP